MIVEKQNEEGEEYFECDICNLSGWDEEELEKHKCTPEQWEELSGDKKDE